MFRLRKKNTNYQDYPEVKSEGNKLRHTSHASFHRLTRLKINESSKLRAKNCDQQQVFIHRKKLIFYYLHMLSGLLFMISYEWRFVYVIIYKVLAMVDAKFLWIHQDRTVKWSLNVFVKRPPRNGEADTFKYCCLFKNNHIEAWCSYYKVR